MLCVMSVWKDEDEELLDLVSLSDDTMNQTGCEDEKDKIIICKKTYLVSLF